MKTIYLREKKSGNFEIVAKDQADHTFTDEQQFIEWYNVVCRGYTKYRRSFGSRIIKKSYRMSQTYFNSAREVIIFNNKL